MTDAFETGGTSPPTTDTRTVTFFLIHAHLIDRARDTLITDFKPLARPLAWRYRVGTDDEPRSEAMAALTEIVRGIDLDRHPGEVAAYIERRLDGAMRRWRTRELAAGVGRGRAKWSEAEPPPRKGVSIIDTDGEGLDISTEGQRDADGVDIEDSLLHFLATDQALDRLDARDRDLIRHVQAGGTLTAWSAAQNPPVSTVRAGQLYERAVERLRGLYFREGRGDVGAEGGEAGGRRGPSSSTSRGPSGIPPLGVARCSEASIRSAVYQGGLKDYATREQGMVGIPEGRLMDWFKSRARYRRSA